MKMLSVFLCCLFALGTVQSVWAAAQGAGGSQGSQSSSPATSPNNFQARDKNGQPMTAEEFAKANDARMKAKIAATQSRLEARQAKWKKINAKTLMDRNGTVTPAQ